MMNPLKIQLVQSNISEQQRRLARAQVKPQINVFANYQLRNDFETDVGTENGYAVGARLNWNFFDAGASSAVAKQEEANQIIAQTRFADTRNKIRLEVEQAYKRLQARAKNIQTASIAFKQAQATLELARLRFQSEVGTQLDVIVAENELTRADSNRVKSILNYNKALAELERAVSR